uniref:Uncharacterized protein n=1 Tax=Glossina austeni TaxID=7395 RepID=A0A1A9VHH6_GLOAU
MLSERTAQSRCLGSSLQNWSSVVPTPLLSPSPSSYVGQLIRESSFQRVDENTAKLHTILIYSYSSQGGILIHSENCVDKLSFPSLKPGIWEYNINVLTQQFVEAMLQSFSAKMGEHVLGLMGLKVTQVKNIIIICERGCQQCNYQALSERKCFMYFVEHF